MYGLGGLGQVEVGERRRRAKWLEEKKEEEEEEEKTKCRSVPDGSDNDLFENQTSIFTHFKIFQARREVQDEDSRKLMLN